MTIASNFQFPYRQDRHGFWGDPTSTLNWCEEDYAISYYIAEACNTLTNVGYLWLGYRGIRSCIRNKHPTIFLLSFIGYLIVGLGSISFHTTLKYPMQLVDELSMIYTTCLMCFATFSYGKSPRFATLLGVSLLGAAVFITGYYHVTKDPSFHQNAYGVLTASAVFWSLYVMEYRLRSELNKRMGPAVSGPLLKDMWLFVAFGLTAFLAGYLIWNLDIWYCGHILHWRNRILLPWAIILEGHGWWHLLTGIGGYYYITWRIWLNTLLDGTETKYELMWPSMFTSLAEVVRVVESTEKDE